MEEFLNYINKSKKDLLLSLEMMFFESKELISLFKSTM
jgi:hypothetical protein